MTYPGRIRHSHPSLSKKPLHGIPNRRFLGSVACFLAAVLTAPLRGGPPACDSKAQWEQRTGTFALKGGRTVDVTSYLPAHLAQKAEARIRELVTWADRSACTRKPLEEDCEGLLGRGTNTRGTRDRIVVTPTMIYWFDLTRDAPLGRATNVTPNGGGGMLRGAWPLRFDGTGQLNFADIRNGNNWSPNVFLPGSTGSREVMQGGGLSAFIAHHYADEGVTYNVENDPAARIARIGETDDSTGLELRIDAKFARTEPGADIYRLGSPGTQGEVTAQTRYVIPRCEREIRVGVTWRNSSRVRVGPVANLLVAHNSLAIPMDRVSSNRSLEILGDPKRQPVYRFRTNDSPALDYQGKVFDYDEEERRLTAARRASNHKIHAPEYRSRPDADQPPPGFRLGSRRDGQRVGTQTTVIPKSGFVSAGTIYDDHSLGEGSTVAAFDLSLFNGHFHLSQDPRLGPLPLSRVPDYIAVEPGKKGDPPTFYLKPGEEIRGEFTMRFDP